MRPEVLIYYRLYFTCKNLYKNFQTGNLTRFSLRCLEKNHTFMHMYVSNHKNKSDKILNTYIHTNIGRERERERDNTFRRMRIMASPSPSLTISSSLVPRTPQPSTLKATFWVQSVTTKPPPLTTWGLLLMISNVSEEEQYNLLTIGIIILALLFLLIMFSPLLVPIEFPILGFLLISSCLLHKLKKINSDANLYRKGGGKGLLSCSCFHGFKSLADFWLDFVWYAREK